MKPAAILLSLVAAVLAQGTIGSEPCPAGFATYSGSSPWGCCKGACPAGSEWEDAEALCFFQGSTASKGDISCATLVAAEKPNPPESSTFEQSSESESVEISQATEESTEEAAVASKASQNESPAAEEVAEDAAEGSSLLLWLAVLAVAAAGGAWFCTAAPTVNRTAILMVGPPGGGKTTLFFTLKDGAVHTGTTSSLKENDATFKVHKREEDDEIHLIDYPGDPKLSSRMADFLPLTKAILFVLDANNKQSVESHAAEQMFKLLTNPMVADHQLPILVACNKNDFPLSSKPPLLRKILEQELTKLRETTGKGNATLDLGEEGPESVPLGVEDEDFTFEKHSPCHVDFIACSTTKGKNLDQLIKFCLEQC
jgi:signal recognition particle receptor subunit beta